MYRYPRLAAAVAVALVVATAVGAKHADAALAPGGGTQRAAALLASGAAVQPVPTASVSCWAGISAPYHNGSNTVSTATWQCSPGVQRQISPTVSLDAPDGTRYTASGNCFSVTYCEVTVSAPWSGGSWTAKAQYAYVVDYDGNSAYFFGGSNTAYLAY